MFARATALALVLSAGPAAAQPSPGGDQAAWAEQCEDWDEWEKPGPPFQVWGNTYYVGTCGIAAILITSNPGTILIDGGPENAGALVAENIEALGFKLSSVTLLLYSHEHHDHVGGLAELQRRTGAMAFASRAALAALTSGTASADDPQFAEHATFPPLKVRPMLGEGDKFKLGNFELVGIPSPGHTPGALSWTWQSCDSAGVCKTIVYADSLTPVSSDDYRFSDHPEYLAAFRASIARVAALDCDILLTPHPSASAMRDRLVAGDLTAGPACREYAQALAKRLDERLASEADGG